MKYTAKAVETPDGPARTMEFDSIRGAVDWCRQFPSGYVKDGDEVVYLRTASYRRTSPE